jgi:putative exporter of polyketide antibiotics
MMSSNKGSNWFSQRAWEPFAQFVNDYWWIFVLVIALILVIVFTRNLWMPALGLGY